MLVILVLISISSWLHIIMFATYSYSNMKMMEQQLQLTEQIYLINWMTDWLTKVDMNKLYWSFVTTKTLNKWNQT